MIKYFVFFFQIYSCLAFALTDFDGNEVPKNSKRIAALTPAVAESIYEMDSVEKLIATTEYTNIPKEKLSRITNIGAFNRINIEKLVSIKPDLVIASRDGNDRKTIEKIKAFNIPVILLDSHTLKDIIRSHQIIAESINQTNHPKLQKLATLTQCLPPKELVKVFIQVGLKPLVTVSKNTFVNDLISISGGLNIFHDAKVSYPKVSSESVIERNPDIILILPMSEHDPAISQSMNHWRQFKQINAVKNSKIFTLQTDSLTKPGFQLVDTYETLKRVFQ